MIAKCPCCGIEFEYEPLKKGEIQNDKDFNKKSASFLIILGVILLPFGIGIFLILMGIVGGISSPIPKRRMKCYNCGRNFEVPSY
jgi:hypothetical protein